MSRYIEYNCCYGDRLLISDHWETVLLLSGDDRKVHVFRLVGSSEQEVYNIAVGQMICHYYQQCTIHEEPCHLSFPELVDLPSRLTFKFKVALIPDFANISNY